MRFQPSSENTWSQKFNMNHKLYSKTFKLIAVAIISLLLSFTMNSVLSQAVKSTGVKKIVKKKKKNKPLVQNPSAESKEVEIIDPAKKDSENEAAKEAKAVQSVKESEEETEEEIEEEEKPKKKKKAITKKSKKKKKKVVEEEEEDEEEEEEVKPKKSKKKTKKEIEAEEEAAEEEKTPAFTVGGFLAIENEIHQEPNGKLKNLSEINKLRLNFQSYINKKTHILAELLPIPEEVTHQIDTLTENKKLEDIDPTGKVVLKTKKAATADTHTGGNGGLADKVIFERAQITFENAYMNQNIRLGQIRLPFGIWEDFTSHRNTTMTKNNGLVLGTALRKVDIGGEIYGKMVLPWLDYNFGFIQGKNVRLQDSTRADDDNKKDLFFRLSVNKFRFAKFGFSSYSVGARNDTGALGTDITIPIGNLTISGEAVYQENRNVKDEFADKRYFKGDRIQFDRGLNRVSTFRSSKSAYVQLNYNLGDYLPGLRTYFMMDYWSMFAMDQLIPITRKVYGGFKYKFIPEGVTLTLEHGRNFHNGIDKGEQHYDIQLEVSF
jgi:hypothetical protein